MRNLEWNRRTEHREKEFGRLIGWRAQESSHRRRKGWLNDRSPSGLSVLVETRGRPRLGDGIEVALGHDQEQAVYHVVRTETLEGNLTLIGCRRDPGAEEPQSESTTPTLRDHAPTGVIAAIAKAVTLLGACVAPRPRAGVDDAALTWRHEH